jgi:hypothetical protein
MAAIDQAMVSLILNALTPTGTAGVPGTSLAALGGTAMKLRLNSTASTAAAAGTEIASGNGYTTGGQAIGTASTASSAGSSVTLPKTTALSWTAATTWSIVSFDLTSSAGTRTFFGNFTGQPISVASGNIFQVAADGITISLS